MPDSYTVVIHPSNRSSLLPLVSPPAAASVPTFDGKKKKSDVGFVDFLDTESATNAKDRFKGQEVRGHTIGAATTTATA